MEMAVAAANNGEQQAAGGDPPAAPTTAPAPNEGVATALLDPQLLMAARHGNKNLLKELLRLNDEEEQAAGTAEATAAATAATSEATVVVQVDGPAPAAPPSSSAEAASLLLHAGVTIDGDSLLHVVAASGGCNRFCECARMIYYNGSRRVLVARNNKGDTPLHCAAAAGNANMVSCLLGLAARGGETAATELLRMRNERGETVLHQAVRAASIACIDRLMSVDPELACIPREGEEGASPLYLAISLGELDIARHLFDTSKGKIKTTLSYYSGSNGRNALHAAVSRGQALDMLLERFKGLTVVDGREGAPRSRPLLSQLTTQRDENGSTPLHLAVSLPGWPSAVQISKQFPRAWPQLKPTMEKLLDANTCAAYQPDNQGLYPIHVAAMVGSLMIVEALLRRCPDCATLRDGKGRTFLHVAVEECCYGVVQYVCSQIEEFSSILNVQDNNGNSALHRAVHAGNLAVFNCLIRNRYVRLDIPNRDGLTPLDLSWIKIPPKMYYRANPRCVIQRSLECVGAPCGGSRADLFREKYIPEMNEKEESKNLTNATQVMGIVSVLVATMTFASAFTLPGGYFQSANDGVPGAPVLGGSYMFDAFVIADGLTFVCSCLATFILLFAGLPAIDFSVRRKYFNISVALMYGTARSLAAAFSLGLYLVLAPVSHTIAIAFCVVGFATLLYGHIPVRQVIWVANTARIRFGIRTPAATVHVFRFLFSAILLPFWSFIIIFGFPAIIRWIKVHRTN